jgi:hypothetical protein
MPVGVPVGVPVGAAVGVSVGVSVGIGAPKVGIGLGSWVGSVEGVSSMAAAAAAVALAVGVSNMPGGMITEADGTGAVGGMMMVPPGVGLPNVSVGHAVGAVGQAVVQALSPGSGVMAVCAPPPTVCASAPVW